MFEGPDLQPEREGIKTVKELFNYIGEKDPKAMERLKKFHPDIEDHIAEGAEDSEEWRQILEGMVRDLDFIEETNRKLDEEGYD